MIVRTSESDPIRVGSILDGLPGKVSLTFAPGKHGPSRISGGPPWARDLAMDLARLQELFGTTDLVTLLTDEELARYGISALPADATKRGLVVRRLPIVDQGTPTDELAVIALVDEVLAAAHQGRHVVIHCAGGLGRAGTIGGCVLVSAGVSYAEARARLHAARGPMCPENDEQRRYIETFAEKMRAARSAGAVLGAAIGDAMGHPTEFLDMREIHRRYGPSGVSRFELFWERPGEGRFAPYTDDTQLAEIVAEALTHREDLDTTMQRIARGFVAWIDRPQGGHRAPGGACLAGARALRGGAHWAEAGGPTAGGCGSVMRAYPFGVAFARDPEQAEAWAVEHSKLTHRDPIALAACAAMARGMAAVMNGVAPERTEQAMIDAARRHDPKTGDMVSRAIDEARSGVGPEVTLDRLRGWAAHEAIAAAAYVIARHPRDPRAAILEGANTPGDSDSIATLAGALAGGRAGIHGLPEEWARDVERSADLLSLANALAACH